MEKFHIYILHSRTLNKYYIGFTSGTVKQRLIQHLSNHKGFTAKSKDWEIVFTKEFESKLEAMAEERKLKAWKNKDRLRNYILRNLSRHNLSE